MIAWRTLAFAAGLADVGVPMKRREFITALGGVTLMGLVSVAARGEAYAQPSKKPIHIGVITFPEARLRGPLHPAFIPGLRQKGYRAGANPPPQCAYPPHLPPPLSH